MREKRLEYLLNKNFNELSFSEKLDLISSKYYSKQKITYEEFVLIALSDEVEFFYNDKLYQIDYGKIGATCLFITTYIDKQVISECNEEFSSIIELFDKFRIDGKRISEIWENVSF